MNSTLEDLAGNNLARRFDREITADSPPPEVGAVISVPFVVR